MKKFALAHFSQFNGHLTLLFVEAESPYDAAVAYLAPGDAAKEFKEDHPTYVSIQEDYLPNVDDYLSILPV